MELDTAAWVVLSLVLVVAASLCVPWCTRPLSRYLLTLGDRSNPQINRITGALMPSLVWLFVSALLIGIGAIVGWIAQDLVAFDLWQSLIKVALFAAVVSFALSRVSELGMRRGIVAGLLSYVAFSLLSVEIQVALAPHTTSNVDCSDRIKEITSREAFQSALSKHGIELRCTSREILAGAYSSLIAPSTVFIEDSTRTQTLSAEHLTGILAHELAHVHYNDIQFSIAIRLVAVVFVCYAVAWTIRRRGNLNSCEVLVQRASLTLLSCVFVWVVDLCVDRTQEKRADSYAVQLGYGTQLADALEEIATLSPTFYASAAYPPIHARIRRIRGSTR